MSDQKTEELYMAIIGLRQEIFRLEDTLKNVKRCKCGDKCK